MPISIFVLKYFAIAIILLPCNNLIMFAFVLKLLRNYSRPHMWGFHDKSPPVGATVRPTGKTHQCQVSGCESHMWAPHGDAALSCQQLWIPHVGPRSATSAVAGPTCTSQKFYISSCGYRIWAHLWDPPVPS